MTLCRCHVTAAQIGHWALLTLAWSESVEERPVVLADAGEDSDAAVAKVADAECYVIDELREVVHRLGQAVGHL